MAAGGWPRFCGPVWAHLPVLWLAVGRLSAAVGGPLPDGVGQWSSVPPSSVYPLFILFYWSIVDLQCCVSFRYTESDSVIHMVLVQSLKLCVTLCGPMDCNMPAFPVLYNLPELAQTHVH